MGICIECGKPLNKHQKKFCGHECKNRYNNRADRRPRNCPVCGVELGPWHKRHCSDECRDAERVQAVEKANESLKHDPNAVLCKCPTCQITYYRILNYKPKTMPRLYCSAHENRRDFSEMF